MLAAELANGRPAVTAIIGPFLQGGLTGCAGLPANTAEEYIPLSVLLLVLAVLKRTWDISIGCFMPGEATALY